MKKPVFIIVIGGIGSGKTTFTKEHLPGYPVIDIDNYVNPGRLNISGAIVRVENELYEYFREGKSVVNTCTGATLPGVKKKLTWAKEHGYITYLVLIDTKPEESINRVKNRETRNDISPEKIIRTNLRARENFPHLSELARISFKMRG